jgi:hypothetical protein
MWCWTPDQDLHPSQRQLIIGRPPAARRQVGQQERVPSQQRKVVRQSPAASRQLKQQQGQSALPARAGGRAATCCKQAGQVAAVEASTVQLDWKGIASRQEAGTPASGRNAHPVRVAQGLVRPQISEADREAVLKTILGPSHPDTRATRRLL